jgi:replicative DNA helicase
LARHVSAGDQVAFFSLEMPYEQLGGKMLSTEVQIGSQDLRTGRISGCVDRLSDAVKRFDELSLTIFDTSKATVGYMRSKLHQLEAKTGKKTGLIIVDYLQLMGGDSARDSQNRVQEVSKISRGLKVLAKDFRCPVVALSQLNRSLESRQDKRPLLSDLRESGSIEQDADIVMFLYRDDYYDQNAPAGVSELILAKQRNGPRCTVPLYFDGRLSKFTDDNFPQEMKTWHA